MSDSSSSSKTEEAKTAVKEDEASEECDNSVLDASAISAKSEEGEDGRKEELSEIDATLRMDCMRKLSLPLYELNNLQSYDSHINFFWRPISCILIVRRLPSRPLLPSDHHFARGPRQVRGGGRRGHIQDEGQAIQVRRRLHDEPVKFRLFLYKLYFTSQELELSSCEFNQMLFVLNRSKSAMD